MINRKQNIPQGWRIDLLENLADRGSGHTPDKNESGYWNGGIKWVSLADSWRLDNLFISETDKEISILGLQNSSAVLHPPDTVILSRDAGVGKSAILKSEMAVSQHFIAWRCQPKNKLNYLFFYYWLQLRKEEFERVAVGSTIKTIGLPYFKKLKIVYPPLAEQKKIAEIINCWDSAIALTEKLITAKRRLKQGLMQKLLTGKVRFPEFKNDLWHMQMLSKACQINIGGTPSRQEPNYWANSSKDGFPWVSIRDMSGRFIARTKEYITAEGIRKSNTKSVPKGTTLMSFKLTIGRVAQAGCELYTNEAIAAFFPKDNLVDQDYLYAALPLAVKRVDTDQAVKGITLNKRKLETLILPILSIREQQKIAQVDKLLDQEISFLDKQLHSLKTQKQGLMQQLLTGKIRIQTP